MLIKKVILALLAMIFLSPATANCGAHDKYIGTVLIDSAGVMHLNLWSSEESHGGAMLLVGPDDPLYKKVIKHVGPIKKGKEVCIKPWRDSEKAVRRN